MSEEDKNRESTKTEREAMEVEEQHTREESLATTEKHRKVWLC